MEDYSREKGPGLPLLSLRLLVPPLRLVSAAILQTVQQKVVRDYGILDEFVTMVTDLVPNLLHDRERSLLSLGLRTQLVLELCRSEEPADLKTIQPHLNRIQRLTPLLSTATEANDLLATVSECNFVGFIQNLLKDPDQKEHFFQDVYPTTFGPMYDEALQMIMSQFLSRLDNRLPLPNLQQASSMLSGAPHFLEECLKSMFNPEGLGPLLEYHKDLNQFDEDDKSVSSIGDHILNALFQSVMENIPTDHEVTKAGVLVSALTDHIYSSQQILVVDSATLTEGEEDETMTIKEENQTEIESQKHFADIIDVSHGNKLLHNAPHVLHSLEETVSWESSVTEVQIGANSEVCDEGLESEEERIDVEPVYQTDWVIRGDGEMELFDTAMLNEESTEVVERSIEVDRFIKEESEDISCIPELNEKVGRITLTDAIISSLLKTPKVKLIRLDPSVARAEQNCSQLKTFTRKAVKNNNSQKVCHGTSTSKGCPLCRKTFSKDSDLKLHQRTHQRRALHRFSCSACKKLFRCMYDLKMHKVNLCQENVSYPPISPPPTCSPKKRQRGARECSVCGKTIRNHSYLVRHMKSHSEERPHRCLLCNKGYKGIHKLNLHSEKCTGPTGESDHQSDEEEESVETPSHVRSAKKGMSEDLRNLDCKVCGETFHYPSVLRRHIKRTHLGVSLFECSKCNEHFTIQSDLVKHQLKVCQDSVPQPTQKLSKKRKDKITLKSSKCEICGKIFAKPSKLQYHMITHNAERPYKCTYCQKTFKYVGHFRRHREVCQLTSEKQMEDISTFRALPAKDQNDAQSSRNSVLLSNNEQSQLTLEDMITHSIPNELEETENDCNFRTAFSPQDLKNSPQQIEVSAHRTDRHEDSNKTECASGTTMSKPSRRSRCIKSHPDVCPYPCPHCEVKFKFKNDLRKHMKGEHDHSDAETLKKIARSLKCDECGKAFMFTSSLRQHKYTHNPLYCIECKRLFPSTVTFSTHRLMHKPRSCTICLESLNGLTQLNQHYLEVHQFCGPFACTSCERSYIDLKGLFKHERVHTGELPFRCPKCPKSFHSKFALATHDKTHTKEKPFLCWDCGKFYRNPGALRSHRLSIHGSDKDKRCVCSHCGIAFALKGNLNKHVAKEHTGVRYPCTYCGKQFLSASSLTRHDLIHTQERPYPCAECDKSFRSASELKIHTRYHTGERPFKCELCGKGFTQSYHLTDHMRMHTGEKPYPCPICEKYFRSTKAVQKHKIIHTGEKPYKCTVCDRAFNRTDVLKAHEKKSH